jgi:hypothetical protein
MILGLDLEMTILTCASSLLKNIYLYTIKSITLETKY